MTLTTNGKLERDEHFAQEIIMKYPNHVCLACNKMKCDCDEDLKIFLGWINGWGDSSAYPFSNDERKIYEMAISDVSSAGRKIFRGRVK